jgi:GT2 family glycosyltransferase
MEKTVNTPRVAIIILNWNGLEDTIECLESLKNVIYPNYKIIVVDNHSSSDDCQILRAKYHDYIHLIQNDRNYGFAKGTNIGMEYAVRNSKPDYFLLLNNDTVVAPDILDNLIQVAESEPEITILAPKIYFYNFNGQKNVIWSAGGKIRSWWHYPLWHVIGTGDNDKSRYGKLANVDWVTGTAMLIPCKLIEKLSILNEDYFFAFEDAEYCIRARKKGFRIVYVPTAKVWHKVSSSLKKHENLERYLIISELINYNYFVRNNFSVLVYLYQVSLLLFILISRLVISYIRSFFKHRDMNIPKWHVLALKGLIRQIRHPATPREYLSREQSQI